MKDIKITYPSILDEIAPFFHRLNLEVYLVGGAVRDILRGKTPKDLDIATSASPELVQQIFKRVIPTGIAHGTVTIIFKNYHIECTTFRTDGHYSDGRHPDTITYTQSINEDLSRRDFTMNAIAINLFDGKLVDPFTGKKDIKHKIIRTVGNPHERFSEDGLRVIRALRFASQLHFKIEKKTLKAIPFHLSILKNVAMERINIEFSKILLSDSPIIALKLMEQTGILGLLIPELIQCKEIFQKDYYSGNLMEHLFLSCEMVSESKLEIKLAALFHDIGKPMSKRNSNNKGSFYNHEFQSANITEIILNRLKFPTKTVKHVVHLVKHHMIYYTDKWTDADIRQFLARIGIEYIDDLLIIREASEWTKTRKKKKNNQLDEFKKRISHIIESKNPLVLKDLAVNGNDLLGIGVNDGKKIGNILNKLMEIVIVAPDLNKKNILLNIVKERYL